MSNPLTILPSLGTLQFLFFLLWVGLEPSVSTHAVYLNTIPWSIGVMLVSLGILWILPLFRSKVGTYAISFRDDRDKGGELMLSYVDSKGGKRDALVVKDVRIFQNRPLMRKVRYSYFESAVKGRKSSVYIKFRRPKIGLALGFSDSEEAKRIYELLKFQDPPTINRINSSPK
jgi:hypothetical protein